MNADQAPQVGPKRRTAAGHGTFQYVVGAAGACKVTHLLVGRHLVERCDDQLMPTGTLDVFDAEAEAVAAAVEAVR